VARATGETGRHIRERGFDQQYYLDVILALVREHGPVGRSEVNDALVSKLPDRLGPEQKRRKVHNLLQEFRRSGRIVNEGTRSRPRWNLGTASHKLANRKRPKSRI
jgi:ATP-dependent DNA helicase RecG